jgi:hypothetical protein
MIKKNFKAICRISCSATATTLQSDKGSTMTNYLC